MRAAARALALALAACAARGALWPSFGGGDARTGCAAGAAGPLGARGEVDYCVEMTGPIGFRVFSAPAVRARANASDAVFAGGTDGGLWAFADNATLWRAETSGSRLTSPTLDARGEAVFFATEGGLPSLLKIWAANGSEAWSVISCGCSLATTPVLRPPARAGSAGAVLVVGSDAVMRAYDEATGEAIWQLELGAEAGSDSVEEGANAALFSGAGAPLLIAATTGGRVVAVNVSADITAVRGAWATPLNASFAGSLTIDEAAGVVLLAAWRPPRFFALNASTGALLYTVNASAFGADVDAGRRAPLTLAPGGGRAYSPVPLAGATPRAAQPWALVALRVADGVVAWLAPLGFSTPHALVAGTGGLVYAAFFESAGANVSTVAGFDGATGARAWRATLPGAWLPGIALALGSNGTLIVPTTEGFLCVISGEAPALRSASPSARALPPPPALAGAPSLPPGPVVAIAVTAAAVLAAAGAAAVYWRRARAAAKQCAAASDDSDPDADASAVIDNPIVFTAPHGRAAAADDPRSQMLLPDDAGGGAPPADPDPPDPLEAFVGGVGGGADGSAGADSADEKIAFGAAAAAPDGAGDKVPLA